MQWPNDRANPRSRETEIRMFDDDTNEAHERRMSQIRELQ